VPLVAVRRLRYLVASDSPSTQYQQYALDQKMPSETPFSRAFFISMQVFDLFFDRLGGFTKQKVNFR
jgi:hypothetical protein